MMFSTVGSASLPAAKSGHTSSAKKFPQIPKGFSVRIFKNPPLASAPYTAKFDAGYRASSFLTPSEHLQSQAWSAPTQRHDVEARLYSHFYNPTLPSAAFISNMGRGISPAPKYSIYPNAAKDTYVYEASLSSKSDLYSNSEPDTASTTSIATPPSSFFSPALSTDSMTTVKSDAPMERSLSRTSQRPPLSTSPSHPQAPPMSRNPSASTNALRDGSYSTALTVTRVASSRGNSSNSGSYASARPKTPSQAAQLSSQGGPRYSTNPYPSTVSAARRLSRSYSNNAWQDALDESLLDAASDLARINASYNAIPNPVHQFPASFANYHESIAPIPLPPDPSMAYGSEPQQYVPMLPDAGPRRTSPDQIAFVRDAQDTQDDDGGGSASWYFSEETQNDSLDQVPESYISSTSMGPTDTRMHSAGGGLAASIPLSSTLEGSSRAPSRNGSIGSSESGHSMPPPIPTQTRPRDNRGISFPEIGQSASQQALAPPNPYQTYAPPVYAANSAAQAFPSSTSATYGNNHGQSRTTPAVGPAGQSTGPPLLPVPGLVRTSSISSGFYPSMENGRARKDSIAVETARMQRQKERPASVSPPPSEVRSRQSSLTSEASRSMALMMISSRNQASDANSRVGSPNQARQLPQDNTPVLAHNQQNPLNIRSPTIINPPQTGHGFPGTTPASSHPSQGSATTGAGVPNQGLPQRQGSLVAVNERRVSPVLQEPSASQAPNPTTQPPRRPLPEPVRRSSDTAVPAQTATVKKPAVPEPVRRHSDGEQVPHRSCVPAAVSKLRVRWHDCLICPSPVFPSQRRKGWFNRRGDQLWTNGGAYKPPPEGDEFPVDLDGYPDYGEGWMNEEGVRIDMEHRLIPKVPRKSALKQSQL